jgi:hypothetical protein
MKPTSRAVAASAATLFTFSVFVMTASAAHAGEYCMTNISGMRGCSFSSMEQCLATASGIVGSCARDPFYTSPNNALAYLPKHPQSRSEHRTEKELVRH